LARESRLEISLVKERSSAVVIIASELSLREKLDYFVGSTLLGTPYFFNLPGSVVVRINDKPLPVVAARTGVNHSLSTAVLTWILIRVRV